MSHVFYNFIFMSNGLMGHVCNGCVDGWMAGGDGHGLKVTCEKLIQPVSKNGKALNSQHHSSF